MRWYLRGVISFSILLHWVPRDMRAPVYWGGDDIDIAVHDGEEYRRKSERRANKLRRLLIPTT